MPSLKPGWYVWKSGLESADGPFTEPQLRGMLRRGELCTEDRLGEVFFEDTEPDAWLPVSEARWLTGPGSLIPVGREISPAPAEPVEKRPSSDRPSHSRPSRLFRSPGFIRIWPILLAAVIAGFPLTYTFGQPNRLFRLGQMDSIRVAADGEIWRLLTAVFIHAGFLHLLFNAYALFILGPFLEYIYGRWRFLSIFLLAGIGGNALSLAAHIEPMVGVGASGAIFGLLGAAISPSWKGGLHFSFEGRIGRSVSMLLPWILLNFAIGLFVPNIDNFAHIGGLFAGFVLGRIFGLPIATGFSFKDFRRLVLSITGIVFAVMLALLIALQHPAIKKVVAAGKKAAADSSALTGRKMPEGRERRRRGIPSASPDISITPDLSASGREAELQAAPPSLSATAATVVKTNVEITASPAATRVPSAMEPSVTSISNSIIPADRETARRRLPENLREVDEQALEELGAINALLKKEVSAREIRRALIFWHRLRFEKLRGRVKREKGGEAAIELQALLEDASRFCRATASRLLGPRSNGAAPGDVIHSSRRKLEILQKRASSLLNFP